MKALFPVLCKVCVGAMLWFVAFAPLPAWAAARLVASPLTWDVLGLDSNDVTVGPTYFPVGTRVCNTGDATATALTATFVWDSSDTYINLRTGSANSLSLASLAAGACSDFYFEVEVTRNAAAYGHTRRYYIEITSTVPGGTITTARPRQFLVERLVSQGRNAVTDLKYGTSVGSLVSVASGGTLSLLLGGEYYIQLVGATSTNGYEQLESFLTLSNTIFQLKSVSSTYTADTSTHVTSPSDMLYADACAWDADPNGPNYLACSDTGKAGGTVTTTYHIKVIGVPAGGTASITTLLYDFSGSSFHYNSDYAVSTRNFTVVTPGDVTFSKAFVADTIEANGTSVLTYTITNPGATAISGVQFTDVFPTSPAALVVASSPNISTTGCGTPTFSPTAGAASITFTNGTIAANSTCTIKVTITAPTLGTYSSTTGHLFVEGSTDTGKTATSTLTVAASTIACTQGSMVTFTVPTGSANPPTYTTKAANVTTATAALLLPASSAIASVGATDSASWEVYGFKTVGRQQVDFVIDTKSVSGVSFSFYVANPGSGNGPTQIVLAADKGSGFSTVLTINTPSTSFVQHTVDLTGLTSTTGNTTLRFTASGALTDQSGGALRFDSVAITGCSYLAPASLSKSFGTSSVRVNDNASTLTFNLSNTATTPYSAVNLTGVGFSDTLPAGLVVATPNGASKTCSGGTLTAVAGSSLITLAGVSMTAGTTCTVAVNVKGTAVGVFENVSGPIDSAEGEPNRAASGFGVAALTVLGPPSMTQVFGVGSMVTGSTTSLNFTMNNPNVATTLSGISFTETLPAGVTVTSGSVAVCGGTLTTTAPSTVTLTGASLSALASCTFSVEVTGTTSGTKTLSSATVTSTNGGSGTSTTATLSVKDLNPAISLLKQVGPSSSGPWWSALAVGAGEAIYYRFTVENLGDAPLSAVTLSDPGLGEFTACTSDFNLPVASAANDDHIYTCVEGPLTAVAGEQSNTASVQGTYNSQNFSDTAAASYATTALDLARSVAGTGFSAVGETVQFNYVVTNTGYAALEGPVTVSDDTFEVICPDLSTIGDGDNFLDPEESITCTATPTVTAADIDLGTLGSAAMAAVAGVTTEEKLASTPFNGCLQEPADPTHGSYSDTACDNAALSSSCTLTCNSGYTKSADATCGEGGIWSAPSCNPNPCAQEPSAPANGSYSATACDGTVSGGTCALTCDEGYTKSGDSTCTAGSWSAPSCSPNPCAQEPSAPANGSYSATACDGTVSGGTCALTCDEGYTKSGDSTCTAGSWSAPSCSPNPCAQEPSAPANGSYSSTACDGTVSGGTCALTCDEGYTKSGDSTCTAGSWSAPSCSPNPCAQEPSAPANGSYPATACDGTVSGGSCALTCDEGYTKSGDASCSLGVWSAPSCEPNPCPNGPSDPSHGSYPESTCDNASSGDICLLTCAPGYTKSADAACYLGTWTAPVCNAPCTTDSDCSGSTAICDTNISTCVECLTGTHCSSGLCNTDINTCAEPCNAGSDCGGDHPHCDLTMRTSQCVACLTTAHCVTGVCDPDAGLCLECMVDEDCSLGEVCDLGSRTCVPTCESNSQCAAPAPVCEVGSGRCVGCNVDNDCPSTRPKCDVERSTCVECLSSLNCGASNALCDTSDNTCVACMAQEDCSGDQLCHPVLHSCTDCVTHDDCVGSQGVCDPLTWTCAAGCSANNDCGGATPLCNTEAQTCASCLTDTDCSGSRHCSGASHTCVDCLNSDHCIGANGVCNLSTFTCSSGCSANNDCGGAAPLCDTEAAQCVGCLSTQDCGEGQTCHPSAKRCASCANDEECVGTQGLCSSITWSCAPGCSANNDCAAPTPLCDTAAKNCVECSTGADCSSGMCNAVRNTCITPCSNSAQCPVVAPHCQAGTLGGAGGGGGFCVECVANDHCLTGLCDLEQGRCVDCLVEGDCVLGQVCEPGSHTCVPGVCEQDGDCAAPAPVCDIGRGRCVACDSHDDCPATAPWCDSEAGLCMQCQLDHDCAGDEPYCDTESHTCVDCLTDGHCAGGWVCHPGIHTCAPCLEGSDCVGSAGVCDPTSWRCVAGCSEDADCGGALPACDTDTATCVECNSGSGCGVGLVCETNLHSCVECLTDTDCASDKPYCDTSTWTCSTTCQADCGDGGGTSPECLVNSDCASSLCDADFNTCVTGCADESECSAQAPRCDKSAGVGLCVPCLTDADCAGEFCDPSTRHCVGCYADSQCDGGMICEVGTHTCVNGACPSDAACAAPAAVCDTAAGAGRCVRCLADGQCTSPTALCSAALHTCVECLDNAACSGSNPLCNVEESTCVQCLNDADCMNATLCHPYTHTCVSCMSDADCEASDKVCSPRTWTCVASSTGKTDNPPPTPYLSGGANCTSSPLTLCGGLLLAAAALLRLLRMFRDTRK